MSKWAWVYLGAMLVLAGVLVCSAGAAFNPAAVDWPTFVILASLAVLAQVFKTEAPSHQSYRPPLMVTFAAILLLPPLLFSVVIAVAHLAGWAATSLRKHSSLRDGYLQPFYIAMHISLAALAGLLFETLSGGQADFRTVQAVLAALVAALVFTGLNHLLMGEALYVGRGVNWKESGSFEIESVLMDLMVALMGISLAALLQLNAWLLLPALSPTYLVSRALSVPTLKRQASTDPKTGLWNDHYFMQVLEAELARSARNNRPLTVVVADLDLLRNINNTFGHLAGDAVLVGVAQILKNLVREYDVVARFGGEEFAILLPETQYREAFQRVEALRQAIEGAHFTATTCSKPIRATMSFGVAGRNGEEHTGKDIIHNADLAVYEAKLRGRNQTCIFSKEMKGMTGILDGLQREA